MFTGIVEELGHIVDLSWHGEAAVLRVRAPLVSADVAAGDSVAVNGVCLTVVEIGDGSFTADVMKETVNRSSLGSLSGGDVVNLERAATLNSRLGGHLVQGHVDAVGTVLAHTRGERWDDVRVSMPVGLSRYVVAKGSICVDGVSLTVVDVDDTGFSVSLIPTTLAATTLGRVEPGTLVNLEVDVIAKYVEKLVTGRIA